MSMKCNDEESTGTSETDWQIFDILCKHIEPPCSDEHLTHSLDLVTTLRSELAASTYKRDRLLNELTEIKSSLCARDSECESLRAQAARQGALIGSLQTRLQASEQRERSLQAKSESTIQSLQRDKRNVDDKNKDLGTRVRRLECDLSTEETNREQAKNQLQDLVRRLCLCLGIDVCDSSHLSSETVVTKAAEIVAELQRLRTRVASTTESLNNNESELLNLRAISCTEKQRMQQQIDSIQSMNQDLENRKRQAERDLQITRDRLNECEVNGEKLRDELRGFESRCCRLQNTLDRFQNDRLQFLRNVSSLICVPEPCETLIKDKLREIVAENESLHTQINNLREQISTETSRHREALESTNCRLRAEEIQKCTVEGSLEKAQQELHVMKAEHLTLSEYLVRLSRALCWSECTEPPAHGTDTTILSETLLERAERLAMHHDHHVHDHGHTHSHVHPNGHSHPHHHHHHTLKLRREKSCHDIPPKEGTAMYTLQRRVRVLREQIQKRDLQLDLLKRKIALLEDGARNKCMVQNERDEAINRARRSAKCAEKSTQQLVDIKAQLADTRAQLSDAADYKITAMERGRKIDELQVRVADLEAEKARLCAQLETYKSRTRCAVESSHEKSRRDEQIITNLRDDLTRLKTQISDVNHRLSQLQTFRTSVARLLHLRDVPHAGILQRLQTLCNAHQEFTLLSRRYESASPIGEHQCPRYDDLIPPTAQCRPLSSSPSHLRRFDDSGLDDRFDDDFDYSKKY